MYFNKIKARRASFKDYLEQTVLWLYLQYNKKKISQQFH